MKGIIFSYLNIRSIYNKTSCLLNYIASNNIVVMGIVETWLNNNIRTSELWFNGFRVHRLDRVGRGGGGIAVLVSNKYMSKVSNTKMSDCIELLHITINTGFSVVNFVTIYRPPSGNVNDFLSDLRKCMNIFGTLTNPTIMVGDFNIDCIKRCPPASDQS